jgi:hypothetical protein
MEDSWWPKVVFNDILCKRKKTWMIQNIKWLSKWDIHLNKCPTNNKEIKTFVIDRFHNELGIKGSREIKSIILKSLTPHTIIIKKRTSGPIYLGEPKCLLPK